jgi:hypothetical protein
VPANREKVMEVIEANSNKNKVYKFVKAKRKKDRNLSRPMGRRDLHMSRQWEKGICILYVQARVVNVITTPS